MAAYAALVSLMHTVDQIQHHPEPPISLDDKQAESLREKVTFLLEFLEGYSHNDGGITSCIADAAYGAEDVIETHIVNRIHGKESPNDEVYHCLEKVIKHVELIKNKAMKIIENRRVQGNELLTQYPLIQADQSSKPPPTREPTMVGFDDLLIDIMDKLTGQRSSRQIIAIVGMGGIGKTTLARNVYQHPHIMHYFHICAWVVISQEFNVREILIEALLSLKYEESKETLSQMSDDKLGEKLYQSLCGRRYLIVMDDMWSTEAWDKIKCFFPDNNNGSRIMLTTRLSELASHLTGSRGLEVPLLDEDVSWNLLRKEVFGEEDCPVELEAIGKRIASKCRGLPLSIVVIGGLLAKSKRDPKYWNTLAENLNAVVNLEDNQRCLKILSMSYMHLPVHLKPCFLYMGVFAEDEAIRVSRLTKLWAAEGFLKPVSGISLEMVAEYYLKELIERNLVLVHSRGSSGNMKSCTIHDLLRDQCLREAHKDMFLCVVSEHNSETIVELNTQRRIVFHESTPKMDHLCEVLNTLESKSLARSSICDSVEVIQPSNGKLLRVFHNESKRSNYSLEALARPRNLRYFSVSRLSGFHLPSSIQFLWNLQTIIIKNRGMVVYAPPEIWRMPQLRHVECGALHLPKPPSGLLDEQEDHFVLKNLRTFQYVLDFWFSEEVVKRIPNIKKLKIFTRGLSEYNFNFDNLSRLHELESLSCQFLSVRPSISFPHSLKKLNLRFYSVSLEDIIMTKIGSLPNLEVLKLNCEFPRPEWEVEDGLFPRLKFLMLDWCTGLEQWTVESTHFPCLEKLVLLGLHQLKEIPSDIGNIPTLRLIQLADCPDAIVVSAKKILEEQEDLGNEDLLVRVRLEPFTKLMPQNLASRNFQFF